MDGTFGNSDILPAFVPVHEPWLFSVQALLFACFQLLVFSGKKVKKFENTKNKFEEAEVLALESLKPCFQRRLLLCVE